ncbi:MAG: hypothetical protein LWW85_03195 [Marinilabiliales bacterium]|nr:hypothetical protein [Marinilabiliales bacterium]
MIRKILCLLLSAIATTVAGQQTEIKYLSGIDKDHTVNWEFYCTGGRNSGKWSTIDVPSNWEFKGYGDFNYGQKESIYHDETGLYRYSFSIPGEWKKRRMVLVFEASMTDTEVKVNGTSAGPMHQGGFYRFSYDVTQLLKPGQENLLEVTVHKESADPTINKAERRGDFWVFGGIYRPVYLEAFPKESIDRVAIDAKADGSFRMNLYLSGIKKADAIEATLLTTDGKSLGHPVRLSLSSPADTTVLQTHVENPPLWNPESPKLCDVLVELKSGKKVLHKIRQRFGFRTVEIKPSDGIYVNGQKILFKGVCRHTAWPASGRCSSRDLSIRDVKLMQEMNMNAVRMSHYPPDQHFLEVCDSLGMFVLDELTGWQAYYSTEQGKRLVRELVVRDVNHPCVVLWDNGNEGGFNKELRTEYAKYDPQQRTVIEPWAKINGTDTKHYPGYNYVDNALSKGDLIYFPTEFLHGLYDGGLGAGLEDYWNLMANSKLAAGGFLWVFADEGIVRSDLNDSIDCHGNNAPDGILGPYREKEGSFYTIQHIWSPVQLKLPAMAAEFNGTTTVANRYLYRTLAGCTLQAKLTHFSGTPGKWTGTSKEWQLTLPSIAPGTETSLSLQMPDKWQDWDLLTLTAFDIDGKMLTAWSLNLSSPLQIRQKLLPPSRETVQKTDEENSWKLTSGKVTLHFNKRDGRLTEAQMGDQTVPLTNGPVWVGDSAHVTTVVASESGLDKTVTVNFDKTSDKIVWTLQPGGILRLDYALQPVGEKEFAGITFDFPEKEVKGAELLANGPYHVWKNRLLGNLFGLHEKSYNRAITGEKWDYPEFKGYYANFYGVRLKTSGIPLTILTDTPGLFLRLFTPDYGKFARGGVAPNFPSGNLSVLHSINAIGTKFTKAEAEGPMGKKTIYREGDPPLTGTLYFLFGDN